MNFGSKKGSSVKLAESEIRQQVRSLQVKWFAFFGLRG